MNLGCCRRITSTIITAVGEKRIKGNLRLTATNIFGVKDNRIRPILKYAQVNTPCCGDQKGSDKNLTRCLEYFSVNI